MRLTKNIKIFVNYVAGPISFLLLAYIIWRQIHHQPNWQDSFHRIAESFSGPGAWKFYAALALMPVNWGIETRKWQLAIRQLEIISFPHAYRAVLAGVVVASFTPNRVGEYLGRMMFLEEGKKLASVPGSVACSLAQMLVTTLVGSVGCYLYAQKLAATPAHNFWQALFYMSCFAAVVLTTVYFRFDPVVRFFAGVSTKYFPRFQPGKLTSVRGSWIILWLSFARYAVFIAQYYLFFSLFEVGTGLADSIVVVSVMFVVMAGIPTFTFLTDLGVRWETGIQVLGAYSANMTGIFATSLGIWMINLIVPALVGSLLILRIKIFTTR